MDDAMLLKGIEEILEAPPGSLTGAEPLDQFEWNSLSVLAFIAFVDENLNVSVPPERIAGCITVSDLIRLASECATAHGNS